MTCFMQDNYSVYDSLPCSAVVFETNDNLDIVYSNAVYDEVFASRYVKIGGDDKVRLDEVLSSSGEPQSIYFKTRKASGQKITARAFVMRISETRAFALMIDDEEIDECYTRYASVISGTQETFFEYNKATDTVTIFVPSDDGNVIMKDVVGFMKNIDNNEFIYEEDRAVIRDVKVDPSETRHRVDVRLRKRLSEEYEWHRIGIRADKREGYYIGSARNINELKKEEEQLKEKALIDPLSKVYNRSAAIEKIERQLNLRLEDCGCALIVMDIDNFKRINDTFGHLYGDAVIAMAAGSIKSTLDEDDVVGRFGGDEFFAFIDNSEREDLERKLEAIRLAILKMRLDANDDKDISCSIGVALGDGTSTYEELFKKADSALYKAKKNGKNRFEYFDGTYAEEGTISYAGGKKDENESTEAHNITAVALEIASKSSNAENAVSNLMRHIGMALELDCIQVMEYDMIEDRVYLSYQWWREIGGEYNVVNTEKRSGYYNHNDLVLFRNRFVKDKIFRYTPDFKEGFSVKYQDLFERAKDITVIYASNTESENMFTGITFHCYNKEREFSQSEYNDMFEITKIISMHTKSSQQVSEREKMLIERIDYRNGLYSIGKFYEEASRIGREARANGEILGVINIDIKDLYGINVAYGVGKGDEVLAEIFEPLRATDNSRVISCTLEGTDMFVVLFRLKPENKELAHQEIIRFLESVSAKFPECTKPPVILKGGLCFYTPGQRVADYIDGAKAAKKGIAFDKSDCVIMENVPSQVDVLPHKR